MPLFGYLIHISGKAEEILHILHIYVVVAPISTHDMGIYYCKQFM